MHFPATYAILPMFHLYVIVYLRSITFPISPTEKVSSTFMGAKLKETFKQIVKTNTINLLTATFQKIIVFLEKWSISSTPKKRVI
jgi:hypothetical protein